MGSPENVKQKIANYLINNINNSNSNSSSNNNNNNSNIYCDNSNSGATHSFVRIG